MPSVAIIAAGMVTGVGLSAPASCAAIRAGIDGFAETRFMFDGEWLIGCEVPLDPPIRGRAKLVRMAAMAVEECLGAIPAIKPEDVPLILALAETDRPGRFDGLDASVLADVASELKMRLHPSSAVISKGRIGGVHALQQAAALVLGGRPAAIVAGVDTYLVAPTLTHLHAQRRLLTADNSDGFIPGEAAAAVVITTEAAAGPPDKPRLRFIGAGYGTEPAPLGSDKPFRADGMVEALRKAFEGAERGYEHVDYRMTDLSGEQFYFKEAALAMTRTMRVRKENFFIWHPADCVGQVGAAIVPACLGVALAAARKRFAPKPVAPSIADGGVLCHFAADGPERAALILAHGSVSLQGGAW